MKGSAMRNILHCMVPALLALGFMPSSAAAQSFELPSAVSPPKGEWTYMRPGSHEATGDDAETQCNRNVRAGLIGLTATDCARLRVMVDGNAGQVVGVPDGIVFNINNGRRNGVSYTTQLVEKKLGRIDRAELFDMGTDKYGNRYFAYFFRGEKTSCNNITWVILPPKPKPTPEPEPEPVPEKIVCRMELVKETPAVTETQFLQGFLLPSCCPTCVAPTFIPPMFTQRQSGGGKTYHMVCERVQIKEKNR